MMTRLSRVLRATAAPMAFAAALSACVQAPTGPSIQATPGARKSAADFAQDNSYCVGLAANSVSGTRNQLNQQQSAQILSDASGLWLQNATATAMQGNATLQQQYDYMFGQCMISRGNLVAGMMAPVGSDYSGTGSGPDPLVRSIQRELVRTGYLNGGVDGSYGPMTRSAILSFESATGMAADPSPTTTLLASLRAAPGVARAAAPPRANVSLVQPVTGGAKPEPSAGLVAPVTQPSSAPPSGAPPSGPSPGGLVSPTTGPAGAPAAGGGLVAPVTSGVGQ